MFTSVKIEVSTIVLDYFQFEKFNFFVRTGLSFIILRAGLFLSRPLIYRKINKKSVDILKTIIKSFNNKYTQKDDIFKTEFKVFISNIFLL
jgi:hypothetical protein